MELSEFKKHHETIDKDNNDKINKVESQAIWKLNDCQELLKSRVSMDYLESRLKELNKISQSKVTQTLI